MAPVKRRPQTRNHHKMKLQRCKPNIPELVYKFLSIGNKEGGESTFDTSETKCRFCKRPKRREEAENSLDVRKVDGKNMANKRKNTRNTKTHRVKRRNELKNQSLSSCMHKCRGGEGIRKMKNYIQKALNFGVESGYLIPKDAAYKVLRVSSDLMSDSNYTNKASNSDRTVSQERDRSPRRTPIRFEDYEVQDARRRRRSRRRRSRSGSRRRRRSRRRTRRRSRSGNTDEIVENDDDFEIDEKRDEKRNNNEDANREEGNERLNQSDAEKTVTKRQVNGSDLSTEDETDNEEGKKRDDTAKSQS